MRSIRTLLASFVLCVTVVVGGTALAHGDLKRADPKPNVHLNRFPQAIELVFAEPPTPDSQFEVLDGCREDVLAGVSGEGPNARLELADGAPGRWSVSYRVVSSVDGHLVRGDYSFHVRNKKPCEPKPEPTDEIGGAAPPVENDDGGGFPMVPVLIGAGVIGAAVAIRVLTRA